jgi:predicted RecB family nuclease
MLLTASDFYTYLRPSKCDLRVYLKYKGEKEAPPGPYEEVLRRLGLRHEQSHLKTFPSYVDLTLGTIDQRERQTKERVAQGASVLYQPVLRAKAVLDGVECVIIGEPDFMINAQGQYFVRDSKICRRITENDHPEILRQLEIYAWLYAQTFGQPPLGLQVHAGNGNIVELTYDGGITALNTLREIFALKRAGSEPFHPVGWSNCGSCGFNGFCWERAVKARDVALVVGVDQGLAAALREIGIQTVDEFITAFEEARLENFQRPWGTRTQKVGRRAGAIMRMARAMATGKESLIQPPEIPDYPNYVMFDLEGLPPHLDELDKIYLWGLQVFGEKAGEFRAAMAGFGNDGDRQGWEEFLKNAGDVFEKYGDICFVHWHHYERVHLDMYVERFGDPDGVAARVRSNLLDLLPITQRSVALPLPSYSLKVVEKYIGFKRKMDEYGGEWAMAKYIEATETEDSDQRAQVLDQILAYNREDLEATWAVLNWLKSKIG